MVSCPLCGEVLVQSVLPTETQLLVHKFLKHQPPIVQAGATVGGLLIGAWLIGKVFGKPGRG